MHVMMLRKPVLIESKAMKLINAIIIFIISTSGFGQTYEKNNRPCVTEICIGDGLQELSNIQWNPIPFKSTKLSETETKDVNNRFRGNIPNELNLYLKTETFDRKALVLLPNVKARCSKDKTTLTGEYTTKAGNKTQVSIVLLQDNGAVEQQWTVVRIRRFVGDYGSNQLTTDDIKSAQSQLAERYKKFNVIDEKGYHKTKLIDNGTFSFNGFATYFSFDLGFSSQDYSSRGQNFRLPPQCARPINID